MIGMTHDIQSSERGDTVVCGALTLASGTPTVAQGKGFTAAKSATGTIKVTLNSVWPAIVSVAVTALHSGGLSLAALKSKTESTAETSFTLTTLQESTGTLAAADISGTVYFVAVLRKTGQAA